jgi:hypothetical protein
MNIFNPKKKDLPCTANILVYLGPDEKRIL